jgi:hypothetical protein
MIVSTRMLYVIYLQCPCLTDFMNYLIHVTPVHPSLCLQYLILLFTIATITAFILLLLLLFHYYHHYRTIATDKPLWTSLFLGAAELTTHLLRLININILWLPLCRINKFGFYFPRRLLQSPILVGHQSPSLSFRPFFISSHHSPFPTLENFLRTKLHTILISNISASKIVNLLFWFSFNSSITPIKA